MSIEYSVPIKGYNGFYIVSVFGVVRSVQRKVKHSKGGLQIVYSKILRQHTNKKTGYNSVVLSKKGKIKTFSVHKLVAENFLEKKTGMVIDHKDRNKLNNCVSNLRYVTQRDNLNNKKQSKYPVGVTYNGDNYSKKYRVRIRIDGNLKDLGSYKTIEEAKNKYLTFKKQLQNGKSTKN